MEEPDGNANTDPPTTTPTRSPISSGRVNVASFTRTSDRRCDEAAAVGVVERLLGDELVHRVRRPPLIGDHRVREVVEVRVPAVLVELLQLGGVLHRVAVG